MQPQIIVLKEGTNSSQGRPQLLSNIGACSAVADAVRTTLGPRGMDKLIVNEQGKATVSNDGATIMNLLNIVHPAARTLVDIAKSQDAEVGDGTTSVVLLAAEFLSQAKPYVEDGVHPQCIVAAYRRGVQHLIEHINKVAVQVKSDVTVNGSSGSVNGSGDVKDSSSGGGGGGGGSVSEQHYNTLLQCAGTALQSKLVHQQRDMFARMVVDAVLSLDHLMPINMIGIKHVQGGALEDSELVEGVAFKKTFSYAGFEMQPKSYTRPRIALLNIELELKAERDNAEIRLDNVQEYQRVVDAEWQILYDKLALIHESGARVVLSRLPIGDVATQYFADRDMFCAGRVPEDDLRRTLRACGGAIVTTAHDLNDSSLGTCGQFVERQIGGERYNVFSECPQTRTCTLVLRGGTEQFLEETERSLHDAIMIVRRTIKHNSVVGGGGAIEMVLSTHLRQLARQVPGKEQLLLLAMARALEVIPRQLCDNAGFDSTAIITQLRQRHAPASCDSGATCWHGVDIANETVADNMAACVWEPALVKVNALTAAAEAACLVLAVDETIKSPRSGGEGGVGDQPVPNMGRGRPM